jgi:hypothetical protein
MSAFEVNFEFSKEKSILQYTKELIIVEERALLGRKYDKQSECHTVIFFKTVYQNQNPTAPLYFLR